MSASKPDGSNQSAMDPEVEKKVVAFTNYCLQQMMSGVDHDAIKRDLIARGISPQLADMLIRQAAEVVAQRLATWHDAATKEQTAAKLSAFDSAAPGSAAPTNPKKDAAKFQMLIGAIALGLGGLITMASYGMSEPGGKYILAYGAIIVGAWNVVSGLWKYGNA
jgi:hypothetical protein